MEGNTAAQEQGRGLPQVTICFVLCIALAGAALLSLRIGAQDISVATSLIHGI